uniref:uncharacterized protein LOC118150111 n=1 Tax=Callithrix jacchus TaxID=9483 RepID=UPI0023DD1F30|nr:uncharacterized protein LOC118150111 [Callithrix jacchus]
MMPCGEKRGIGACQTPGTENLLELSSDQAPPPGDPPNQASVLQGPAPSRVLRDSRNAPIWPKVFWETGANSLQVHELTSGTHHNPQGAPLLQGTNPLPRPPSGHAHRGKGGWGKGTRTSSCRRPPSPALRCLPGDLRGAPLPPPAQGRFPSQAIALHLSYQVLHDHLQERQQRRDQPVPGPTSDGLGPRSPRRDLSVWPRAHPFLPRSRAAIGWRPARRGASIGWAEPPALARRRRTRLPLPSALSHLKKCYWQGAGHRLGGGGRWSQQNRFLSLSYRLCSKSVTIASCGPFLIRLDPSAEPQRLI